MQNLKDRVQHLERENRRLHEALMQADRLHRQYMQSLSLIKQAKKELQASDALNKAILDSALDCIICMNQKGCIIEFNATAEKVFGYACDDVLGRDLSEVIISPSLREKHKQGLKKRCLEDDGSRSFNKRMETVGMRADGTEFPVELAITKVPQGNSFIFSGFVRDLSKHKDAEEKLKQNLEGAEKARRAMLCMLEDLNESSAVIEQAKQDWEQTFDAISDPVFMHDDEGRLVRTNRAFATLVKEPIEKIAGQRYDYLLGRIIPAMKNVQHDACHDGQTEQEIQDIDGHTFLLLADVVLNKDAEFRFCIHIMRDITVRKQVEEALKLSREKMREGLIGTIHAVAKAAEARDPYTAGHQRRVASLSLAIGKGMGLDEDQLVGIHLGAMIHDIGKIHLPIEILSKPTRLSDVEYRMIYTHAQVGYDILRDITFPWPVADIAYQHHERLDGSGYPQGLSNGSICMEARIVAVADVVEAMSSHRPYRPGLGIDKALEEIKRGRDKQYDASAVDACLNLFSKKLFTFEYE